MTAPRRHLTVLLPTLGGGGAERVIVTLLRHFDRSLFRLSLVVIDARDAVYRQDVPDDVEFIDLGCRRVRHALPRLRSLLWRTRPDLLLSTLGHMNLAIGLLRPLLPRSTRYFARETAVVSYVVAAQHPRWLWRLAYRFLYRGFDRVICQSADMRDDLAQHFGMPPQQAVVIHNPVEIERVRTLAASGSPACGTGGPERAGLRLVAVGRLSHEKGFDLLIDALALLADPAIRLEIVGEGPLRDALAAQARDRGVDRQIEFCGFQRNPYPAIARADALVQSSRFEGFPNVVLEALAVGTAVITTPCPGGALALVRSVAGCVVAQATTAQALAQAIAGFDPRCPIPADAVSAFDARRITAAYEAALQ